MKLHRTLYELAGGEPTFRALVERFYGRVATDPVLRPRLRMRHLPFVIGQAERDAWMGHMRAAVESLGLSPPLSKALLDYFESASKAMINQPSAESQPQG
jgi:hemoglobin